MYDNGALAVRSLLMLLFGMSISSVFAFFVWLSYPKNVQANDKEKAITETAEQTDSNTNGKVCYAYCTFMHTLMKHYSSCFTYCKATNF